MIGRGLDQLEQEKSGGVPHSNLARFAQGPKTASELVQLASDTDLKYGAFEKRIGTHKNDVANRAEQIDADMNRLTDLPCHQRAALAAKELTRYRRELREKTDKERYSDLRGLQEAEAAVNAVAPLYESPAHMLAREGFGTEDRSRYLAQMAHSGPTEVANYAALAVNTRNKTLGAAVMSRLDAMRPEERKLAGVSRHELANVLCGQDFRRAQEAITIVRNRVRSAFNRNREFELGKVNAKACIGEALDSRRETGVLDDADEDG
jgi:hypothetical protein